MTDKRFLSLLVWLNGGVPAALLAWDAWHGHLGANPVNFAIRTTGLLCLIFLGLSLLVTPLRQLLGWAWLFPQRRTLGLLGAFYAFAHFGIFFWWDRAANVASTVSEIVARKYLWFGATALVIFVPLTLTSTQAAIRRLGPGRWKNLHRLVYLAAIAGGVHYLLVGKYVMTQAIVFACVFAGLLLYRFAAPSIERLRAARRKRDAAARRPKFWRGDLRVASVTRETPDVQTFRLVPADGAPRLPFTWMPGQYLNLTLDVDGRAVNRSYTIASPPSRPEYCEISVKREGMGVASRHLHDMLKVGDAVRVGAPSGRFTFDGTTSDKLLMVAGGVGITPLMSKLRFLTDVRWRGPIDLVFVARTEADIIFAKELDATVRAHPNVRVTVALTRADDGWRGERGRLTPEMLRRAVPDAATREAHVCGPDAMAAEARRVLAEVGVPEGRIKFESFTPPSRGGDRPADAAVAAANSDGRVDGAIDGPVALTFARSGQTVEPTDGETVLDAAEAAGVEIESDCRSGICGTCRIRLVSGQVAMDTQDALTAADRATGLILACQARCRGAVTVDA